MHPKYQEVIKLRLKGKSYREIARELGVSKSLLSDWLRDLKLPSSARKILEAKTRHSMEKLAEYNRLKAERVQLENRKIRKNAADQIGPLSKDELLLVGAALYWGEGWKSERSNKGCVEISNSDPFLVALFLRFLREIIGISDEKLKVYVHVHPNIDPRSAIHFWSKVTGIPSERFRITRQISRASKRKRPRKSLPYGTLHLRVHKRQKFFQIKGWIDGLKSQSGLQ